MELSFRVLWLLLLMERWTLSQADVIIRASEVTRYSCFCSHSQDNKTHKLQNVFVIAIVILLGFLVKFICIPQHKTKQNKIYRNLWPFGQYSNCFLCTFNILHKTYTCTSNEMVKNFLLRCLDFPYGPKIAQSTCTVNCVHKSMTQFTHF